MPTARTRNDGTSIASTTDASTSTPRYLVQWPEPLREARVASVPPPAPPDWPDHLGRPQRGEIVVVVYGITERSLVTPAQWTVRRQLVDRPFFMRRESDTICQLRTVGRREEIFPGSPHFREARGALFPIRGLNFSPIALEDLPVVYAQWVQATRPDYEVAQAALAELGTPSEDDEETVATVRRVPTFKFGGLWREGIEITVEEVPFTVFLRLQASSYGPGFCLQLCDVYGQAVGNLLELRGGPVDRPHEGSVALLRGVPQEISPFPLDSRGRLYLDSE